MKKYIITLSALLILSLLLPAAAGASEKVNFQTYDKGKKLVKNLKKRGFIFFHADWCKYCKQMDKEAFSNTEVIEYLNDNFISITVDTDVEEKLAEKYKAQRLPMLYFLKKDGSVLTYRPGYVETKELLYMLKFINTESYMKMSFTDFVNQNK